MFLESSLRFRLVVCSNPLLHLIVSRTCNKFQRIKCIVTTITPIPGDKEAFKKAHPSCSLSM